MKKTCFIAALAALLAAPVAASVYRAGDLGNRTYAWDPASHALNGLRLSDGITRLDPPGFFRELVVPHHYPPVHAILQTPFYLVMGRTPDASRLTSAVALAALVILSALLARRLGADLVGGPVLMAAAAASSPLLLAVAGAPMLELFGPLGYVCFALVYARSLEKPDDSRRAYAAGAAAALVYFTTINYALMLFAAVAVFEALRGDMRAAVREVRDFFRGYRWLNVWNLFAALSLLTALVVKITGGFQVPKFSLTSPLPPISVAMAFVAVQLGLELWKRREGMRRWPPRLKGFFWATLVPLVLWFAIYPPRMRLTLDFVHGTGTGRTTLHDWLRMYPSAWLGEYHLSAAIGLLSLAALVSTVVFWRRLSEAARFVSVLTLVVSAGIWFHPQRDLRFVVGVLPLYWIVLVAEIFRHSRNRKWIGSAAAVLLAATAFPALRYHRESLAPRIASIWHGPAGTAAALRIVGEEAAARSSVRLLGFDNGLSWHAVEFEIRRHRSMRGFTLAVALGSPGKTGQSPADLFDRWVVMRPEERVITIEPSGLDPYMSGYGPDYAACLERSTRFRLVRDAPYPGRALRIRVWDRVEPP